MQLSIRPMTLRGKSFLVWDLSPASLGATYAGKGGSCQYRSWLDRLGKLVPLMGTLLALVLWGEVRSPEESLAEVKYLLQSGVPASAIRAYVEAEDLRFALGAEDLVALKEAGAGEGLLLYLIERSRRAGEPVDIEGATVIYEAKGVRAFRKKDATGREVLVVTNLDENGLRLDGPPDLPEAASADRAPEEEAQERPRKEAESPTHRTVEASLEPPPSPEPTRPPQARGRVYVGPFYQFVPSNVPGPGSPWSPVFQILPVPWAWPFVSVYPHFALTPIYSFYGIDGSYRFSRNSCYACLR